MRFQAVQRLNIRYFQFLQMRPQHGWEHAIFFSHTSELVVLKTFYSPVYKIAQCHFQDCEALFQSIQDFENVCI